MKAQMLLWLVCFNIPMGPWSSDQRFHECKMVLNDLYKHHDARSTPVFISMSGKMLKDEKFRDLEGEDDPLCALWNRMKAEDPWHTKGVKVVKSRFVAFAKKAEQEAINVKTLLGEMMGMQWLRSPVQEN